MKCGAARSFLINCNRDFLGDGSEIFGRFFIALIRRAAQARDESQWTSAPPATSYIDEVPAIHFQRPQRHRDARDARKYKVAMLLAHQYLSQLDRVTVQPAVQGCAIKMVGQPNE